MRLIAPAWPEKFIPAVYMVIGGALLFSNGACGAPGVVLDGSMGTAGPLTGPNYLITAGMGRQIGPNLFQSFSSFNLTSAESATFTAAGSTGPISNILARVTGGSASSIDGTITSQIAGANLFLLNPAGVMVGPDAQVNVSGSFVVGTPSYATLAGGGVFNTALGDDSQLSSAPVSAFGFLAATPQPVTFAGSQLHVSAGMGLHVIAGDITLDQGASLLAPSGKLTLFSAASAGEVPFGLAAPGTGFAAATNASFGTITLRNQSSAAIDGAGGGGVTIRGGKLVADNSSITSNNSGAVQGGAISIQAGQVSLTGGAAIGADAEVNSTAPSGSVTVTATGDIDLSGAGANGVGSEISTHTYTASNAGSVDVTAAGALSVGDGSAIIANTDGDGAAGALTVHAQTATLGDGSNISSSSAGNGNGGDVEVDVAQTLSLIDNASINASTFAGVGGNVIVRALQLNINGTSTVAANATYGTAAGGNVDVETGSLSIQGPGALTPAFGRLLGLCGIQAESFDFGNAGSVTVNTGSLSMSGGATISADSIGAGEGGRVTVNCSVGELAHQSEISSTSFTDAGSVTVTASQSLKLSGDSFINTSAGGNGGDITLRVGSLIYLDDSDILAFAGLTYIPGLQVGGNGGNILIDPQFVVLGNSLISANDLASIGSDGNILNQTDFFFSSNSSLKATGTIDTTSPDLDLAQSLYALPSDLVNTKHQLREKCAAAMNHEFSSFIVVGRGGTESAPEEFQPDFGNP